MRNAEKKRKASYNIIAIDNLFVENLKTVVEYVASYIHNDIGSYIANTYIIVEIIAIPTQ